MDRSIGLTAINEDGTTPSGSSLLDDIVREGAWRMLAAALEAEVNAYIGELTDERDGDGRRLVVRTATTSRGRSPRLPARSRSGPRA